MRGRWKGIRKGWADRGKIDEERRETAREKPEGRRDSGWRGTAKVPGSRGLGFQFSSRVHSSPSASRVFSCPSHARPSPQGPRVTISELQSGRPPRSRHPTIHRHSPSTLPSVYPARSASPRPPALIHVCQSSGPRRRRARHAQANLLAISRSAIPSPLHSRPHPSSRATSSSTTYQSLNVSLTLVDVDPRNGRFPFCLASP